MIRHLFIASIYIISCFFILYIISSHHYVFVDLFNYLILKSIRSTLLHVVCTDKYVTFHLCLPSANQMITDIDIFHTYYFPINEMYILLVAGYLLYILYFFFYTYTKPFLFAVEHYYLRRILYLLFSLYFVCVYTIYFMYFVIAHNAILFNYFTIMAPDVHSLLFFVVFICTYTLISLYKLLYSSGNFSKFIFMIPFILLCAFLFSFIICCYIVALLICIELMIYLSL